MTARDRAGRYARQANAAPSTSLMPVANPALAKAMHGLRSSSAASPHDTRPNRQRTRADARRAAIADGY